ncbi:MAG: DUF2909 family protein [Spongiibacteraceae bacterium]
MWLKIIIIILFIGLVVSLFSSLRFLLKERNTAAAASSWTRHIPSVRIALAVLLIGFLFYGVFTGQLGSNAPWDARYKESPQPSQTTPGLQPSEQLLPE